MTDHTTSRYAGDPRVTEIEPGRLYHLHDPDNPDDPPWIILYSYASTRWHVYGPEGRPETDANDDTLDDAIYNVAGLALWEAESHLITHAVAMDGWLAASYCGPSPERRYAMTGLVDRGVFAERDDAPAGRGRYTITPDGMDLYDQLVVIVEQAASWEDAQAATHELLDDIRAAYATT